ncbi:DNA-damage-inducible SOS response protein [Serratia fonticola]|uniref:DNA-damage-inducible SOS response protein n=1 Tax=Serratia fonticola TaxID=47917 RepID=A0A4U9TIV8_SERFO|nr:DNA-damage-inducible SOS response protein [Serratia fonticola]
MEIRWLSAPAALANMVLLGWLLGVQYVRAPVILLIVGNLLNIVLDIWLVMGLGWNVQGAATATVIAEYATLLLGLWFSMAGTTHAGDFAGDAAHRLAWGICAACWHLTATSCCARYYCNCVSPR